jgi:acetyltransferase-like isoleucine patch superfamily enzyme
VIVPPARVETPRWVEVGAGVVIHEHGWLEVRQLADRSEPSLVFEDDSRLNRFVKIVCFDSVRVGEGALLSDRVYVSDVEYEPGHADTPPAMRPLTEPRPVVIGAGVLVGIGAIVKPGVTIGDHAYIGAGSIVTKDVPSRALAVGAPARIVKRWDASGNEIHPQAG